MTGMMSSSSNAASIAVLAAVTRCALPSPSAPNFFTTLKVPLPPLPCEPDELLLPSNTDKGRLLPALEPLLEPPESNELAAERAGVPLSRGLCSNEDVCSRRRAGVG